ncbi:MAG: DMT family transporter [Anaerolineae bacterium]|nr:DMT family transporter [Anaerolineae bacterium]
MSGPGRGRSSASGRAIVAALLSPVFLGAAPIFGKLATNAGVDPFTVAAVRTILAVGILWAGYLIFWREYTYIYPAALLGCVMVGVVNGIGSIFYYNGLARLDASVAQLLNSAYLVFVVILARLGGTMMTQRTALRVALACIAVVLLTMPSADRVDWLGVGFMLANALLFAGHVIMGQRVLFEIPPQTFTLYVLTTMGVVVTLARAVYDTRWIPPSTEGLAAIVALAVTTALSRLLLFTGVKKLGGLQTILLGVAEIALALGAAMIFLGESLSALQWVGAGFMLGSMFLMRTDSETPTGVDPNAVALPNYAGMVFFQKSVAFNAAFLQGIPEDELEAIRRMVGPSAAAFFGAQTPEELEAVLKMVQADDVRSGEYVIGPHLDSDGAPARQARPRQDRAQSPTTSGRAEKPQT